MLMVVEPQSLQNLSAEELRELTTRLMTQLRHQSALLDKLTHENELLKRMKFAAQSERFNPEQKSLLEDEIEADLAAVATEIDALQEAQAPAKLEEKRSPKRAPPPPPPPPRPPPPTPHPPHRPAGAVSVAQVRSPPAAVPPGSDLWSSRPRHPALHTRSVGGLLWRAVAAAGGGDEGRAAATPRAAC